MAEGSWRPHEIPTLISLGETVQVSTTEVFSCFLRVHSSQVYITDSIILLVLPDHGDPLFEYSSLHLCSAMQNLWSPLILYNLQSFHAQKDLLCMKGGFPSLNRLEPSWHCIRKQKCNTLLHSIPPRPRALLLHMWEYL